MARCAVVQLGWRNRSLDLGSRAHHYTLLTLARARLEDRAANVPAAEEGWLYRDELARRLAQDDNLVHTHIHRARRQFAKAGFLDASSVVQWRASNHKVRLGVGNVRVARAER